MDKDRPKLRVLSSVPISELPQQVGAVPAADSSSSTEEASRSAGLGQAGAESERVTRGLPPRGAPTKNQVRLMRYFLSRERARLPPPTYRELCKEFGWNSVATARDALKALANRGLIERVDTSPIGGTVDEREARVSPTRTSRSWRLTDKARRSVARMKLVTENDDE